MEFLMDAIMNLTLKLTMLSNLLDMVQTLKVITGWSETLGVKAGEIMDISRCSGNLKQFVELTALL